MYMGIADYDHSLVSLANSVLKRFGAECNHSTLKEMDDLLAKGFKNVVVMLFDGMGSAILDKHADKAPFLRAHTVGAISSVFPPTTTAATTSVETGLTPYEHGWLGWTLYFKDIDKNVCVFPNVIFGSDQQAESYHVARRYLPFETLEDKIRKVGKKAYFVSKYSPFKTQSLQEICDVVRTLCKEDGEKYIYCYWNQPDFDMHDFGTSHERVAEHIAQIDDEVHNLCNDLDDALVVAIADHGLVDVEWQSLCDYPEIFDCLERMPSLEARALSFYIKDGRQDEFAKAFNARFGSDYDLYTHEQVLALSLFGEGKKNAFFDDFVGDFLAVAKGRLSLTPFALDGEEFKAMHAGACKDELSVPLVAIECR